MPSLPVSPEAPGISVCLIAAWPDRVWQHTLRLPAGSTLAHALAAVDWPTQAGAPVDRSRIGVFGRMVRSDHPLEDGDRIEIYRPLLADPKASRRARAAAGGRR